MSRLVIGREAVEEVLLENAVDPTHLSEDVVEQLLSDPKLRELGHGALEFGTKEFPGSSAEARQGMEGVILGVALAIDIIRHQTERDTQEHLAA